MIIKVEHWKCGEVDSSTYLFCQDNKTQDEIDIDVQWAADSHVQELKKFDSSNKPKYLQGRLDEFDNLCTIEQAKSLLEKNKTEWTEYYNEKAKTTESFNYWMKQRGYKSLSEMEGIYCTSVSWGHNHGLSINMSPTDINYIPKKIDNE